MGTIKRLLSVLSAYFICPFHLHLSISTQGAYSTFRDTVSLWVCWIQHPNRGGVAAAACPQVQPVAILRVYPLQAHMHKHDVHIHASIHIHMTGPTKQHQHLCTRRQHKQLNPVPFSGSSQWRSISGKYICPCNVSPSSSWPLDLQAPKAQHPAPFAGAHIRTHTDTHPSIPKPPALLTSQSSEMLANGHTLTPPPPPIHSRRWLPDTWPCNPPYCSKCWHLDPHVHTRRGK